MRISLAPVPHFTTGYKTYEAKILFLAVFLCSLLMCGGVG
jgi:hypothetical protein